MHRITVLAAVAGMTAGLAMAESWSGKLIDANCKASNSPNQEQSAASCAPTISTKVFAIQTPDGKVYRLDNAGNTKAAEAVKSEPSKTNVTVSGTMEGQMVKVDSIDLR